MRTTSCGMVRNSLARAWAVGEGYWEGVCVCGGGGGGYMQSHYDSDATNTFCATGIMKSLK